MSDLQIVQGYVPGALGRIAELHGQYYHAQWGFGLFFEAKVASELAAFLQRYDQQRDGFWTASRNGRVEGTITIDGLHGSEEGAHLRWFIVSDLLRGQGVGQQLLHAALGFCRSQRYPRICLWTFEGLAAARHLYQEAGFVLAEQRPGRQWGTEVQEQRFVLAL